MSKVSNMHQNNHENKLNFNSPAYKNTVDNRANQINPVLRPSNKSK